LIITRHGRPVARLVAAPPQRPSGQELLARFDASYERLRAENPDIDKVTWEEILDWRDG
jgi:antitoxin (DNA-binding transcriptional repressor) of toxin-antitoxin stability system